MSSPSPAAPSPALSPTVWRLGWVSLLTDVSGDLVTTLLPFFLVGTLGASFGFVGVIDGAAESISSLLKIVSGRLADGRVRKKRLVLLGYGIAAFARPLLALASAPLHVLLVRVADRLGKGVRSAPRDAWIADVTPPDQRGRAYGVHRAMDNAGAFLRPIVGLFLYRGLGLDLQLVFALTIIPGILAVVLAASAKEPVVPSAPTPSEQPTPVIDAPMPPRLRAFFVVLFVVLFVFTLSTSSDSFILLRGREIGIDETLVLETWIAFAGIRTLLTAPGSALADRIGRRVSLLAGWALYALVYVGFSRVASWTTWTVTLFVYAGFYALTEGAERALVAEMAPAAKRGAAFGWFHGVTGVAALPASWAFGALSDHYDMAFAFQIDAGLAVLAAIALAVIVRTEPRVTGAR